MLHDLVWYKAFDISIPLHFNGEQPNAWGVERAASRPVVAGEMIGDTRRGGSVNFEQYTFIPHCSGTHTECVGHITHERISIRDCLKSVFIPVTLLTLEPEISGDDLMIGLEAFERSFQAVMPTFTGINGLVLRTLPNGDWKKTAQYGEENIPPYLTAEAMDRIVDLDVQHLLVDLPSIDRIFDDGKLANHRKFWNVEPGSHEVNPETRLNCTITEMIYVPDDIPDGEYLLNLQIAPFEADCSPSRPILLLSEVED